MYQFILARMEQHPVSSHFKFNRGKFSAVKVHMPYYQKLHKKYYSDISYFSTSNFNHLNEIIIWSVDFICIELLTRMI